MTNIGASTSFRKIANFTGISPNSVERYSNYLSDAYMIFFVKRFSEITKEDAYPFVWNDPSEMDGIGKSPRGLGMRTFGEDVFDEFLQVNELERMVRGHSVVKGGFKWWFWGRLLSLDGAIGVWDGEAVFTFNG